MKALSHIDFPHIYTYIYIYITHIPTWPCFLPLSGRSVWLGTMSMRLRLALPECINVPHVSYYEAVVVYYDSNLQCLVQVASMFLFFVSSVVVSVSCPWSAFWGLHYILWWLWSAPSGEELCSNPWVAPRSGVYAILPALALFTSSGTVPDRVPSGRVVIPFRCPTKGTVGVRRGRCTSLELRAVQEV